ncbi:hypothetical protein [[Actinomadura] parvosata]|nr:hypothetical protein [Nonomuraea sp. ATCC 55076]
MSIADFSGRTRPDACPGALQVHEAADGPLARVRLPGGAASRAQLHTLADCAEKFGSGVLELTSRANLQVRGLHSPTAFADHLATAGLLPSPAHERVRNIIASPLSGRRTGGSLDPTPLVHALDQALCSRPRLAGLPGRFLFAVDDGTGDVAGLGADVTYVANHAAATPRPTHFHEAPTIPPWDNAPSSAALRDARSGEAHARFGTAHASGRSGGAHTDARSGAHADGRSGAHADGRSGATRAGEAHAGGHSTEMHMDAPSGDAHANLPSGDMHTGEGSGGRHTGRRSAEAHVDARSGDAHADGSSGDAHADGSSGGGHASGRSADPHADAPSGDAQGDGRSGGGRLLLAGCDTGLTCGPEAAVPLMIAAAEAFLDERPDDAPLAWRIQELENGPARITARLTTNPDVRALTSGPITGPTIQHPTNDPAIGPAIQAATNDSAHGLRRAGRVVQRDGRVALEVLVPLGRLTPAQLRVLADSGPAVRFTPWRTAVLLDLSPAEADRAERALADAGLVTDPASPWAGVTACTGRPGCGKALADVQADARRWVEGLDRAPETPVHWAGCERRCGLPRGRVVEVIATGDGYRRQPQ